MRQILVLNGTKVDALLLVVLRLICDHALNQVRLPDVIETFVLVVVANDKNGCFIVCCHSLLGL